MKKYLVVAAIVIGLASASREADAAASINCHDVTLSPSVNIPYDAIRTTLGADVVQTTNVSFLCDVFSIGNKTATATLSLNSTTHSMTNSANPGLPLTYNLYIGSTIWGPSSPPYAVITKTFTANGLNQASGTTVLTVKIPGGQNAYKGTYSDSPAWTVTTSIN